MLKSTFFTYIDFSKLCITQKRKIDIIFFQTLNFKFTMYLRARKKIKLLSQKFPEFYRAIKIADLPRHEKLGGFFF